MRRWPLALAGLFLAAVSVLQYRLIAASLSSLAAWTVLTASDPAGSSRYWNPGLVEYWLAALAWIAACVWLLRSVRAGGEQRRQSWLARAPGVTGTRGWSHRVIGAVAWVALASPFLTPVDPDVQGDLATVRLLPPLSSGYVREYLVVGEEASGDIGWAQQTYNRAVGYLLNRLALVDGQGGMSGGDARRERQIVREYPIAFLFGTDDNARDVFSRVIAGTRISIGVGISAALGALLIGVVVGFPAGLSRGAAGSILMRLTDVFLAVPGLFLVIGALAFIGQSIATIIVVLSLTGWMPIARVVRGEVVSLRERQFVLAAQLLRVSRWKIISRHLWPNLRPVVVTATVLQFANAVLGEAALGFLGLGVQPPTATWGNMMGEATGYLASAWWVGVFPGFVLAAVVVSAHSMGEHPATRRNSIRAATQSEM